MIVEENKELCKKYPFLRIRNVWTNEYDDTYEYTWLDDMPEGWRKCFGLQMCDDILAALIESGIKPEDYQIVQIKEKYGSLRWYDNGAPEKVHDVILKYGYLSEHVCINCGKIDVPIYYNGWVYPCCDKCAKEIYENIEKAMIEEANLKSSFTVHRFNKGKEYSIKLDISDILKRIGHKIK